MSERIVLRGILQFGLAIAVLVFGASAVALPSESNMATRSSALAYATAILIGLAISAPSGPARRGHREAGPEEGPGRERPPDSGRRLRPGSPSSP